MLKKANVTNNYANRNRDTGTVAGAAASLGANAYTGSSFADTNIDINTDYLVFSPGGTAYFRTFLTAMYSEMLTC